MIRHPVGIVVGNGVLAGERCTFQHGVTLGSKYVGESGKTAYLEIRTSVVLGSFCVIVGNVRVGDNSTIGALTFIDKDVASGSVITGRQATV